MAAEQNHFTRRGDKRKKNRILAKTEQIQIMDHLGTAYVRKESN